MRLNTLSTIHSNNTHSNGTDTICVQLCALFGTVIPTDTLYTVYAFECATYIDAVACRCGANVRPQTNRIQTILFIFDWHIRIPDDGRRPTTDDQDADNDTRMAKRHRTDIPRNAIGLVHAIAHKCWTLISLRIDGTRARNHANRNITY